jgi:flagellar hook-associated protein 3 FlgL
MATGKKISVPSMTRCAARALKLRTDVAEVDQFKKNSNDASS